MKNVSGVEIFLSAARNPLFVAFFACSICSLALWMQPQKKKTGRIDVRVEAPTWRIQKIFHEYRLNVLLSAFSSAVTSILILAWSQSFVITLPFSFFSAIITWAFLVRRKVRETERITEAWPEVIDHLISALYSGLSLSEALAGLSTRGPAIVREDFLAFKNELLRTGDFGQATETLKTRFNSHGSDQILEAILLAKSLGGSELLQIFRTLGEFLRQDLAVRKEIEMKHGWIKNSAHLSSAAPWLLLLLLSSQPGTARAFSQPSGIIILAAGVVMTAIAYLWMGKLGQLPKAPRVFRNSLS